MHTGRHLENLNPPQLEAVQHHHGPILVLAGAGTGKTRILTRRIAHLILEHKARPSSIFAVTFTNKACGEMRERLHLLLGQVAENIWISTFHSAGLRILRRHAKLLGFSSDFVVYDSQDSKEVLKRIIKAKNIDDKKFPVGLFHSYIDQKKNVGEYPEDLKGTPSEYSDILKKEVYDLYQRQLLNSNAMDFGDLLSLTYKLFLKYPEVLSLYQDQLDFILVDEFQDTNIVQYSIIQMLTGQKKNILVVGDDDQSIYAFRGATIKNILEFEKDFSGAKVVKLEQNYRSTGNILESAHAVIVKNRGRKDKKVWTGAEAGEKVQLFCGYNESDEAQHIANEIKRRVDGGLTFKDIALFYRTNAQSRAIEEAFLNSRIPYRIFGGLKFYDRKEIKDILAYLRLIANKNDSQAFLRVINTPTRGIGAQAIQQIQNYAQEHEICFFDAATGLGKTNKNLRSFVNLIQSLKERYSSGNLFDLISDVIEKSEYGARLKALKDDPTAQSRLENLQELKGIAITLEINPEEDPLQQFLDRVALTSSEELPAEAAKEKGAQIDAVSLMTLHLAKGLEFDIVFFTGFEEGLMPHYRAMYDPDEVEEERRLCYVGMTRARHSLFITRCQKRGMFSAGGDIGSASRFREPSRFAFDIPKLAYNDISEGFFENIAAFEDDSNEGNYSYEDDLSNGFKKRPKVAPSKSKALLSMGRVDLLSSGILKTADTLDVEYPLEEYDHLPLLSVQETTEGKRVFHPSFGRGIVQNIDGDVEDKKASFKVIVKFDKFNESKKLVFRYAALRAEY